MVVNETEYEVVPYNMGVEAVEYGETKLMPKEFSAEECVPS